MPVNSSAHTGHQMCEHRTFCFSLLKLQNRPRWHEVAMSTGMEMLRVPGGRLAKVGKPRMTRTVVGPERIFWNAWRPALYIKQSACGLHTPPELAIAPDIRDYRRMQKQT